MKYRKKPVVVEAFQMTEKRRKDNADWPEWLHRAWNEPAGSTGSVYPILREPYLGRVGGLLWASVMVGLEKEGEDHLVIGTTEGKMRVEWGDWIIQGVKGELYACKPDIFEATYETVEDPSKCTVCGGRRKVTREALAPYYSPGTLFFAQVPCPACLGTGRPK